MSSYESLLENYALDERFDNITFEEMGSILESLTEFVNEEVTCTVEISLQEAEDESIKDKAGKIKEAASKGIKGLIAKLQAFIGKITEAVKAFVAKARKTIAVGGNEAVGKILRKNKNATLNKDVKVSTLLENKAKVLFNMSLSAVDSINKALGGIEVGGSIPEVPAEVKKAKEAFKEKLDRSSLVTDATASKGSTFAKMYDYYVGKILDLVKTNLAPIQKATDDAKKAAKDTINKLNKAKDKAEATDIAKISMLANTAMQMNTYAINYASSVLTIATKNSAKLALAAGGVAIDNAKAGAKSKIDDVKDKFKKDKK